MRDENLSKIAGTDGWVCPPCLPQKRHSLISLVSSAVLSVDLGYQACDCNGTVSAVCGYSAVNASSPSVQRNLLYVTFNKSCCSRIQLALLNGASPTVHRLCIWNRTCSYAFATLVNSS